MGLIASCRCTGSGHAHQQRAPARLAGWRWIDELETVVAKRESLLDLVPQLFCLGFLVADGSSRGLDTHGDFCRPFERVRQQHTAPFESAFPMRRIGLRELETARSRDFGD